MNAVCVIPALSFHSLADPVAPRNFCAYCVHMTHPTGRKQPAPPDQGQAYTAAVMRQVKQLRQARDWSAEHLAAEMADSGVPWTRDTVVNLENGRRKRIAAHELLALA